MKTTPSLILSVKAGMDATGLMYEDVAAGMGISRPSLSSRMTGRTRFTVDDLDALVHLFGVSHGDLLAGPGDWLRGLDKEAVRRRAGITGTDRMLAAS